MPHLSSDLPHSNASDLASCRALLANGSKSFFAASFLLPAEVRDPATALYAFCRLADDLVDLNKGGNTGAVLVELRERLDRIYAGVPSLVPADRAFAHVVATHELPRELPLALLEGFEWDSAGRRYETFGDLTAYAVRVAGTVGMMMAVLMGARSAAALARACDLGVAMQLTNIARDVGEDARAGRLYLPLAWMREMGCDPETWLKRPAFNAAIGAMVERLLAEADFLYSRAESGIRELPAGCRPGIFAARFLYAEIGREVERARLDSVTRRAHVSMPRKLVLLAKAVVAAQTGGLAAQLPPIAAAEHLFASIRTTADSCSGSVLTALMPPWWNLTARFARTVELFERLGRMERDRSARDGRGPAIAAASVAE